jgi:GNAT superfamily N-acetyltransferase
MQVGVRRATHDDAAALAELRLGPLAEGGVPLSEHEVARYVESFTTWVAANIATHRPFAAVVGSDGIGAAWLMLAERVPSPERQSRRWCGDIQSVFVVPEFRGCGVGKTLLEVVLSEARRLELEHVTVHSNDLATSLYQRVGFGHDANWLSWNP